MKAPASPLAWFLLLLAAALIPVSCAGTDEPEISAHDLRNLPSGQHTGTYHCGGTPLTRVSATPSPVNHSP